MEFENVIRNRKSTRLFSSKEVEEEKLIKILEAGRIAPTAKNIQPFKLYVIKSKEGLKKIDKATICRYKAPVVIMICADKNLSYSKEGHSTYEMDSSIAGTHMMLEATNLGVDNIWIKYYDEKVLIKEFNLPDNLIPVCLLPMGYKSKLCPPSPFHNKRKKLDDLVIYW